MSEQELMQFVKSVWYTTIMGACEASSIPPAFLAALIAGESGGKNDAKRFEPAVLHALWEVLLGRKAAFGSIGRADLVAFVSGLSDIPAATPTILPTDSYQRLDSLATSWGLTQIMGYHVLERTMDRSVDSLRNPTQGLLVSNKLLTIFAVHFQLDVAKDFEQLFRCWNTGQPDGKTFDPAYVNNGLTRMAIWTSLP